MPSYKPEWKCTKTAVSGGKCGADINTCCANGECCGPDGTCGIGDRYCGKGCNKEAGPCDPTNPPVRPSTNNTIQNGYCGPRFKDAKCYPGNFLPGSSAKFAGFVRMNLGPHILCAVTAGASFPSEPCS